MNDNTRDIRWYGWRPQLPNPFEAKYLTRKVVRLAPKFDQRGTPTMPSIYDQGQLGSCVGHGVTAVTEQALAIEGKSVGPLSRLMCYYDARRIEGTTSQDAGAQISDGVTGVAKWGLCTEVLWPYDISKFASLPPPKARQNGAKHKAVKSYAVNQASADLKQCISEGFGVVFGFTVYESFESAAVAKTGVMPMPSHSEQIVGGHCFTGDTKVSLLDGREVSMKVLTEEFKDKQFWVYSCDADGNVVPGKAYAPRLTRKDAAIVEVVLDNGEKIRCTPDHQFLMRDGTYREAQALTTGSSLMPLYRRPSKLKGMNDYEQHYNPASKKWRFTHRTAIAPYLGDVVHHLDFNKHNNSPENLVAMGWMEHTKLHNDHAILLENYAKSLKGRNKSRALMTALWANPEWRKKRCEQNGINGKRILTALSERGENYLQRITKEQRSAIAKTAGVAGRGKKRSRESVAKTVETKRVRMLNDPLYRERIASTAIRNLARHNEQYAAGIVGVSELQRSARRENVKIAHAARMEKMICANNHKVVSVSVVGSEDVYDLTVEKYHNFALSAGVFVHNCVVLVGYDDSARRFIVRNSWGTDWGQLGYFTMPYDYALNPDLSSDFKTIRLVK